MPLKTVPNPPCPINDFTLKFCVAAASCFNVNILPRLVSSVAPVREASPVLNQVKSNAITGKVYDWIMDNVQNLRLVWTNHVIHQIRYLLKGKSKLVETTVSLTSYPLSCVSAKNKKNPLSCVIVENEQLMLKVKLLVKIIMLYMTSLTQ